MATTQRIKAPTKLSAARAMSAQRRSLPRGRVGAPTLSATTHAADDESGSGGSTERDYEKRFASARRPLDQQVDTGGSSRSVRMRAARCASVRFRSSTSILWHRGLVPASSEYRYTAASSSR